MLLRIRASSTAECDRAPVNGRPAIAALMTSAPSWPASFGGLDGAPQRVGVLEDFLGVVRACVVAHCLGVPAVCLGTALVHPDRVQHAEVVCI